MTTVEPAGIVDTLAMCDQCCHMVPKSERRVCKRPLSHMPNSTNQWLPVNRLWFMHLCQQCAFTARLEGRL